jgi:arylsulfatase A-like enzyme
MRLLLLCLAAVIVGCSSKDDSAPAATCELLLEPTAPAAAFQRTVDTPLRHLVLVTWDTTRRDHIGPFADDPELTPSLDALMAAGLNLTDHYSCSNWTLPSMTCLLTGLDAVTSGYYPLNLDPVPAELPRMAQVLAAEGYQSALFSTNELVGEMSTLNAGYDQTTLYVKTTYAQQVIDDALAWLDSVDAAAQPIFLHVHLMDAHQPYAPPPEYLTGLEALPPVDYDLSTIEGTNRMQQDWWSLSAEDQADLLAHIDVRYSGGIRHMDDQVGRLVAELAPRGLADETLVVVASDHGEQFYEYGRLGHTHSVYGVESAAFAFLYAPDMVPVAWEGPTDHPDLMPTILDALGLEPKLPLSGKVVGTADSMRAAYSLMAGNSDGTFLAVKASYGRLVYHWEDGALELFDHRVDPDEASPIRDLSRCETTYLWENAMAPAVEGLQPMLGVMPVIPPF